MDEDECLGGLESDMTLYGLLTFMDPPKEDAAAAVAHLQRAGVEIKVLTGDNLRIALKVCRSLNIFRPDSADVLEAGVNAITGTELARLTPAEFRETVLKCFIFAKLTPAQKGDVVMALKQHRGQVVGMLGDGINDCIALRTADVGISVDSAVPVAKECADVILATKSLSIIADGVRTGRITHGNSIKYIKMVASSNFGNVFSVVVASAWLPYQPMTALQILVQNLLYDISQIALPWDHMDEEYLRVPRQWNTWDLLRFIAVLGPTSSTIDMCTFCLDWFYYGIQTADSPLVRRAHTHWFLEGLLTQTLIVHLLRTAKIPFIQSRASWPLLISTSAIMIIGVVIPYIGPVAKILAMIRPSRSFIGFLVAEPLLYCLEVQLVKVVYKWLFKVWL
jgi:Mg2+-importing ATPase